MVSRILISIALLCGSVAFSQEENGLKFNQVLLVELTSEGVVVPEGKVWKVMSAVSELPGLTGSVYLYINGNKCELSKSSYIGSSVGGSAAVSATTPLNSLSVFPMWLPSGVNISTGEYVSALSIIEFNTN